MSDYLLADFYQAAGIACPSKLIQIKMPLQPWPHQIEDLHCLANNERFGIWNDAGTGKTLAMQASLAMWAALGNPAVMVMPPKLIGQWVGSFKKDFVGIDKVLDICPFGKYSARKRKQLMVSWQSGEAKPPDILVLSYNLFRDLHPIKRKPGTRHREAVKPLRHHPLKLLGFVVLDFDEAHALKNNASTIHKIVWRWVGDSQGEYVVHLFTGSPIPNTLMDAYGMIRMVYPEAYPTKRSFERKHVVFDQFSEYREVEEYINTDTLYENLYRHGRRVTKQEVLKDLPPMIPVQQEITLSPEHRKLYRRLMKERILELPEGSIIDATNASKLRQIALQIISSPELFTDEKIKNELDDWLDELIISINPNDHKIIIFSYFKATVKKLRAKYAKYNPAVIFGETKDSEYEREKFINDPSCRLAILNIDSGGVGLNLQIAYYMIFYEPPLTPMQANQCIARSHRGGQLHAVTAYFARVLSTLAARRLDNLLGKEAENNKVVRDRHQLLCELLGEE